MRIRTKLIASYATIGVMLSTVAFVTFTLTARQHAEFGKFHAETMYRALELDALANSSFEESFAYVVSGRFEEKEAFLAGNREFKRRAASFAALARLSDGTEAHEAELFDRLIVAEVDLGSRAEAMFAEYEAKRAVAWRRSIVTRRPWTGSTRP